MFLASSPNNPVVYLPKLYPHSPILIFPLTFWHIRSIITGKGQPNPVPFARLLAEQTSPVPAVSHRRAAGFRDTNGAALVQASRCRLVGDTASPLRMSRRNKRAPAPRCLPLSSLP
jgi:hypothetical protein